LKFDLLTWICQPKLDLFGRFATGNYQEGAG
jgi:hypothetical protein